MITMVGRTAPDWIYNLSGNAQFLFNFILRSDLYYATTLTTGRALQFYASRLHKSTFVVKLLRQKAEVPRDNILESAIKIMSDTALMKYGNLEFKYLDEVGIGIGPTLEFYSLVSKEVRKLPIWRNSGEASGLFPAPIIDNHDEVLDYFQFIGKLTAKAIMDGRLVDLPFSSAFWKLVMKKPITINDLL